MQQAGPPEDIKKAMSHEQALAQTDNYLRNAGITPVPAYDTAGSAKLVREQGLESLPLNNPAAMVQMLRGNPALLQKLRETNADLAAACEAGDVA